MLIFTWGNIYRAQLFVLAFNRINVEFVQIIPTADQALWYFFAVQMNPKWEWGV